MVATHGDLAKNKTSNEELRKKVEARFGNVFTIEVVASIYCFTTITPNPPKINFTDNLHPEGLEPGGRLARSLLPRPQGPQGFPAG